MFETGTYKSLPEHVALYKALEASMERANRDEFLAKRDKSRKRRRDDQDPPPPLLDLDLSKKKRHNSGASGSSQPPAPQSSSWKTTDTRESPSSSSKQQSGPHAEQPDEDIPMPDTANISDSEETDYVHLPKIKQRLEWLKPIPEEDKPETPERLKKLSKSDLEGPAYKVAKAFHENIISLQFQMEEYHRMLTDQVDLVNPEGHQLVPDVTKVEDQYDISAAYGISHWWFKRKEFYITRYYAPSDRSTVRSHMRILSVVSLKTYERYGYAFLKETILRRANYKEYMISEADFKNLHPNHFEDLYLLHLQDWDASDFLFKEDYTIVSKSRAVIYKDRNDQKKMMRETEVHKFSDGTLQRILDKLDHMVKDFRLYEYNKGMETRIWSIMIEGGEPLSSSGALSFMKNLDDAYTIVDQFINNKSTEDEPCKLNMESEVVSMVTVLIHQASSLIPPLSTPIIDLSPPKPLAARVIAFEKKYYDLEKKNKNLDNTSQNLRSRVFTLELRDLPHKINEAIRESVKEAVHMALQALLRDCFRELPEADMKEILYQRMFETGTYKSLPEHVALYEALKARLEWVYKERLLIEECHRMLTDQVDLVNLEGHRLVPDYLVSGDKGRKSALSISKLKAAHYLDFRPEELVLSLWIESEREYDISVVYETVLRRADYKEYKISEADFKNLHPNDFKDLYMLHLQGQLNHLSGLCQSSISSTKVNLWVKERNSSSGKRVVDLQLEDYTIVSKPRAVIYIDRSDQKKMMRETKVHKFSDGTLNRILDMVKDFKLYEYNPSMATRIWYEDDRRRSKDFMEVIERRLKIRRIFMSLESFVGGRLRDVDYKLIQRTE
ncbi:hypothetical protein Tco_0563565 [Tanacetum coccineum]